MSDSMDWPMDDNPYKAPASAWSSAEFYTDDITLMPIIAIWRALRGQPLFGRVLAFLYILARKALGKRFPANHGTRRPTELTSVPPDEIPGDIRAALAPFDDACTARTMKHLGYFRPQWIGNKRGLVSLWLDPTGATSCSITWIDMRLGSFRKTKVVFACHSTLASGVELHTGPVAPEDWIPEVVPPNQELMRLPVDVQPSHVIERHRERLANRSDVVCFNVDSLLTETVRRSQDLFDYLVAKRIYTPLTVEEAERLSATN